MHIAFRLNANLKTGSGHLHRCIALASGFNETLPGSKITFLVSDSLDYLETITGAGYAAIDLGHISSPYHDYELISDFIGSQPIDILIIDSYDTDEKMLANLKAKVGLLALFDDYTHLQKYPVHVLINNNMCAHNAAYSCDSDTLLLLGTDYAQLRSEFDSYSDFERVVDDRVRRILVTFGGSDFKGATLLTVKALKQIKEHFVATLVLGKSFRGESDLLKEIGMDERFIIAKNVNDMASRMASSDIAISTPSTTFYELAFMKVPAILIKQFENQGMIDDYVGKNGFAVSLGDIEKLTVSKLSYEISKLMSDMQIRKHLAHSIDGLVDGMGRYRLAEELIEIYTNKKSSETNE